MTEEEAEEYLRSTPPYSATQWDQEAWNEMARQAFHAPLFDTGGKKASRLRRRYWAITRRVSQIWYVARHGYPDDY